MSALRPAPRLYTIAPDKPFADALVDGLLHGGILDGVGGDPLALSRATILLPNRRACRTLSEAFLRRSQTAAMLLPRIRPLGDLDEDEAGAPGLAEGGELAPAMAPLRRQFLLAKLILARDTDSQVDQAMRLAEELGALLDQAASERLDLAGLAKLAPERHAAHWQKVLDFLKILVAHWPDILAENEALDGAARRNAVLDELAETWRKAPPGHPVIAAGSTGSLPATADLLAVIARLPAGCVVLPGLDAALDAESWRALGPSHPQFGLKQLLGRIGASRDDARPWPSPNIPAGATARVDLVSRAMHPAETVGAWRGLPKIDDQAMRDFTLVECAGASAEAGVVALRLRDCLEGDGVTAALVTADRGLARRVAAELRRWGIAIDDSAGAPLAKTAPGVFLRLTARLIAERAAPAVFLAALKHPYAAGGGAPEDFRRMVRRVERAVLRGARPEPGLDGLERALRASGADAAEAADWLAALAAQATPFAACAAGRGALADLLREHIAFAEWLAASDGEAGAARLWAGEAGEAAARFIAELAEQAPHAPELGGRDYPAMLDALMQGRVVRPRYGGHPRLFIWGPLEARLQRADVMILGGLNEGSWPPEPDADPWMSRAMRAEFGLPPHERRIGLSAHDFAQCCGAPQVMLTRARRVAGEPTVPSRWITRLKAVLAPDGLDAQLEQEAHSWLRWRDMLDEPEGPRQPTNPPAPRPPAPRPPAPCPPVAARPRRLSVTQIETWLRDPYAIYARHILGLRRLDDIDADPGAAERGTVIHDILDRFIAELGTAPPDTALPRLLALGEREFARFARAPGIMAFWWPRFERIARWFIDNEAAWRSAAAPLACEVSGEVVLDGPHGPFTLRAKADRIDRLRGGGLAIIDYKTGTVPSEKQVAAGLSPQLPLEALIAEAGGFKGVPAEAVARLAYWRLAGGEPPGERKPLKGDVAELTAAARQGLLELIARFDDPATPYHPLPRPDAAPGWNDYAHLERIQEWSSGGGGGES